MKKIIALFLSVAMVGLMTGCSSKETKGNGLSGNVTVGGSTSVESVVLSAIEIFNEKNPDVTITYDPTGSSTGVKSAASGDYDIGLASRDVKESEVTDLNVKGTAFAIDGIAIILNNQNSIDDLTVEEIASIASGEVANWSELGGEDAPIVLIGREAGSGTRDGFESIVGVDECVYEQALTSTGAVIGAVSQNPNAIGYASFSSVDDKVKAISVEGVVASESTIKDGSYKIQRNFNFITVKGKELSAPAKAFYDFLLSSDAKELISNAGAVSTAK